jgi:hypothetical protein
LRGSVASGSCGAMSPPRAVQSTQKTTMTAPARNVRERRSSCSCSRRARCSSSAGGRAAGDAGAGVAGPRATPSAPSGATGCRRVGRRRRRLPGRTVMRPPYLRAGGRLWRLRRSTSFVDRRGAPLAAVAFAWEEGSASATCALFPLPRCGSDAGLAQIPARCLLRVLPGPPTCRPFAVAVGRALGSYVTNTTL